MPFVSGELPRSGGEGETGLKKPTETFLIALQALSKAERKAVVNRLLEDPNMREDILDLALIRQRQGKPSRPFREYFAERKK
ncbi:MAG: hypothetical protein Q7R34_03650 [Dehalococcoidia bacterium]|nr:hypothetical protein [Dehalococcoidia bacterium]